MLFRRSRDRAPSAAATQPHTTQHGNNPPHTTQPDTAPRSIAPRRVGIRRVVVLTVVAAGLFAAGAFAAQSDPVARFLGAYPSHQLFEEFEISIGIDNLGNPRKPRKQQEIRTQINVPKYYGEIIGFQFAGAKAVFWYQDTHGTIRNMVIPDSDTALYTLDRCPVGRYETGRVR